MQHILPISQIMARSAAIRLPRRVLELESNIRRSTIIRALKKGGCRSQTLQALGEVVVRHEQEMLAHLERLHPQPEHGDGEAE
jgi:hypothetical protein